MLWMSEDLQLIVRTPEVQGGIMVAPLGSGLFRVAEAAWFWEAFDYGDVVELHDAGDGRHDFVRIVAPCPLVRRTSVVSKTVADSVELEQFFNEIRAVGGYCELAMGGAVFVAVPVDADSDLERRFMDVCRRAAG